MKHAKKGGRWAARVLSGGMALGLTLALVGCGDRSPEESVREARKHLTAGDARAAVIEIKNALQKQPGLAEARFLMGQVLLEQGDAQGAAVELQRALEGGWSADQTQPLLARALLASAGGDATIKRFSGVTLGTPVAQAQLQSVMAVAYIGQDKFDRAMAAVDAALKAQPDHLEAALLKVRLQAAAGDMADAVAALKPLLEKHPDDASVWLTQGDILRGQHQAEPAIAAYREALKRDPKALEPRYALVQLLLARNDKAVDDELAELRKQAPQAVQTRFFAAQRTFAKGEVGTARDQVQELLKQYPEHERVLELAGAIEAQRGALPQAENYLGKAAQMSGERAPVRLMLAEVQLRQGEPAKTLRTLQAMTGVDAPHPDALGLAGQAALTTGDFKAAEQFFQRRLTLRPDDARAKTSLAMARLGQGREEQAMAELEAAAAADMSGTADVALVSGLIRKRQYDRALQVAARLEKKPGMAASGQMLRAQISTLKADKPAAREAYEAALKSNPGLLQAASSLAVMDGQEGRWNDAVQRFDGVVKADPKNVDAHLALIATRERAGGKPEATTQALRDLVKAQPDAPQARVALVETLIRQRDAKAAVSAAQEARAALTGNADVLHSLGRAQLANGDHQQALASFRELAALWPRSPLPQIRQAEALAAAKQSTQAVQLLRKTLTDNPDDPDVPRLVVGALVDDKRTPEALQVALEVQKVRPRLPLGFVLEGDVRTLNQDLPRAATAYQQALARRASTEVAMKLHRVLTVSQSPELARFESQWLAAHPKDVAFHAYLADAAMAAGQQDLARRRFTRLIEIAPDNAVAYNNLAWLMAQAKDPKAVEFAQKARKLSPAEPAFLDTEAEIRAGNGQFSEAIALQAQAVEMAPNQPVFRFHLARYYISAGQKAQAKDHLTKLAALGERFPQHAEVRDILKSL